MRSYKPSLVVDTEAWFYFTCNDEGCEWLSDSAPIEEKNSGFYISGHSPVFHHMNLHYVSCPECEWQDNDPHLDLDEAYATLERHLDKEHPEEDSNL